MSEEASQASTAALVHCFFDETTRGLGAWIRERGGQVTYDLTHANRAGKLERTTPEHIDGFFSAVVDFATPDILGTLKFGDREFLIEAIATPNGRAERHALWEWADAIGQSELVPRNAIFVLQLARVSEIVSALAIAIRELEPVVTKASPDVLDRMSAARIVRQSAQEAEWRASEHHGTVRIADEAFRRGDWRRVATLLESVKDRLTPAELAKLEFVRKRL